MDNVYVMFSLIFKMSLSALAYVCLKRVHKVEPSSEQ